MSFHETGDAYFLAPADVVLILHGRYGGPGVDRIPMHRHEWYEIPAGYHGVLLDSSIDLHGEDILLFAGDRFRLKRKPKNRFDLATVEVNRKS